MAALVATAAAQPAIRELRRRTSARRRGAVPHVRRQSLDARRVIADGAVRLERARALGLQFHSALLDVPTGVATLTNRMMPLLFPTGDERGVAGGARPFAEDPAAAARASSRPRARRQLGALTLAADRSYFNPARRKRRARRVQRPRHATSSASTGRCRLLRRHRIEPFLIRVARPGRADLRRPRADPRRIDP